MAAPRFCLISGAELIVSGIGASTTVSAALASVAEAAGLPAARIQLQNSDTRTRLDAHAPLPDRVLVVVLTDSIASDCVEEQRFLEAFRDTRIKSIHSLHHATIIRIANEGLRALPDRIGDLRNLRVLLLEGNRLTSLPDSVGRLRGLMHLDLDDNELTDLPQSIGNLHSLVHLDLRANRLTSLPECVGRLAALLRLDLDDNQLSALPESMGQLRALRQLALSENELTTLPSSMGRLARLFKLQVGGNRLRELPECVLQLQALAHLDLSENPLARVPDALWRLPCLRRLVLGGSRASLQERQLVPQVALCAVAPGWTVSKTGGYTSIIERLQVSHNMAGSAPPTTDMAPHVALPENPPDGFGSLRDLLMEEVVDVDRRSFEDEAFEDPPDQHQASASAASAPQPVPAEVLVRLQILDGQGAERRADVYMERRATIADLKARHFREEIAQGWNPRCVSLGRLMRDGELVAQLPPGSFLQCMLQRPPSVASDAARFPGQGPQSIAVSKGQDLIFHLVFATCLAITWAAYLSGWGAFDFFGKFALHFFTVLWIAVCVSDFLSDSSAVSGLVAT